MSPPGNDARKRAYGCCFAYERDVGKPSSANVEATELILQTYESLGCEVLNGDNPREEEMEVDAGESDEEENMDSEDENGTSHSEITKKAQRKIFPESVILNQKPKDTDTFLGEMVKRKTNALYFLLYFNVKQVDAKFMTEENTEVPILKLLKNFEKLVVPVLVFIQANVKVGQDQRFTALLNKNGGDGGDVNNVMPKSANILVSYLPQYGSEAITVAKILHEELCNMYEIKTNLTNVIDRLNAEGCRPNPMFSSTLIKPLYLAESLPITMGQEPKKYSYEKRYRGYAFLFGKYMDKRLSDLSCLIELDKKSLKTLEDLGVEMEYCVQDGIMTVADFKKELTKIVQKEDWDSFDSVFIIVSTHGHWDGKLHAYDDIFTVDDIWQELLKCKKLQGKPKVMWIDACRGDERETSVRKQDTSSRTDRHPWSATSGEKNLTMSDVLIAYATTEWKVSDGIPYVGSIFTKHVCDKLKNYKGEDFLSVLTSAMESVAMRKIEYKQQPTFTSTLSRLLYLPKKNQ